MPSSPPSLAGLILPKPPAVHQVLSQALLPRRRDLDCAQGNPPRAKLQTSHHPIKGPCCRAGFPSVGGRTWHAAPPLDIHAADCRRSRSACSCCSLSSCCLFGVEEGKGGEEGVRTTLQGKKEKSHPQGPSPTSTLCHSLVGWRLWQNWAQDPGNCKATHCGGRSSACGAPTAAQKFREVRMEAASGEGREG